MLIVLALIVLIPPIASALDMCALNGWQWLAVIGLTLVPMLVAEYGKMWDAIRSRAAEKTAVRR